MEIGKRTAWIGVFVISGVFWLLEVLAIYLVFY